MRLFRKHSPPVSDAEQAIAEAVSAGTEAGERLISAQKVRAGASQQAAHEQRTIISELRAMREHNHLADLVLESIKRGAR
jgi:hypothetical protein